MANSTRGGRSGSISLNPLGLVHRVSQQLQAIGPRMGLRIIFVCMLAVSWKASGALIVPVVAVLGWWLARGALWAYGLPRWLPILGKRFRGRRYIMAQRGYAIPSFPAMLKARRAENKRFALVRSRWTTVADCNSDLVGQGGSLIPLLKLRTTLEGDVVAEVRSGPLGVPPDRFVKRTKEIKSTVGCPDFAVRYIGTEAAELTFYWTQELERHVSVAESKEGPAGTITFGKRRGGVPAYIYMASTLVSSMTGGGKSGICWALFANLNLLGQRHGWRWDLWCCDPKGGVEAKSLSMLADGTSSIDVQQGPLRVRAYASDVAGTGEVIVEFHAAMKARLNEQAFRKWTPNHSDQQPLMVLFIDELVEVISLLDTQTKRVLLSTISQARAAGAMVLACTQMAQKNVLGDVRDMFPQRLSGPQRTAINTDMALGDGAEADGAACSLIPLPSGAGQGFSYSENSRGYEPFRAFWCSDEDVETYISHGLVPPGMGDDKVAATTNPQCALYRLYNELGELLYIGRSQTPGDRWKAHANPSSGNDFKPWWPEVCMTGAHKPFVEWFPTVDEADHAETAAIETELPKYNDRKQPKDNPLRVNWRAERKAAKQAEFGPLEPELAALDYEVPLASLFDVAGEPDPQPANDSPEPITLPEVPLPEVETPEGTQPEPETPELEPREDGTEWQQPPAANPETRSTHKRRPRQYAGSGRRYSR